MGNRKFLKQGAINTTNIYAEVDLEMKAKALAYCEVKNTKENQHWHDYKELMNFLESL